MHTAFFAATFLIFVGQVWNLPLERIGRLKTCPTSALDKLATASRRWRLTLSSSEFNARGDSMPEVVIVGAGLAGLACATRLSQSGIDFQILEASERVGGRVRTDVVERFQLDHGFQFLPCDDPGLRQWLDYDLLRLRKFDPQLLVGSGDRLGPLEKDSPLPTHSPFWRRMLRLFLEGEAAIPADGMGAIPRHLAERLPRGSVALQRTVVGLRSSSQGNQRSQGKTVAELSDGSSLEARVVVVATESSAADRLASPWRTAASERFDAPWDAAQTLYFAADAGAFEGMSAETGEGTGGAHRGLIVCDDETAGPIHHIALLSNIAPEYAPPGRALVSVSLVAGQDESQWPLIGTPLVELVRRQLQPWFGPVVDSWTHLRTYAIPYAAPAQELGNPVLRSVEPLGETGPVVCGDHREAGTIQGATIQAALNSGLRAAEAVGRRLR